MPRATRFAPDAYSAARRRAKLRPQHDRHWATCWRHATGAGRDGRRQRPAGARGQTSTPVDDQRGFRWRTTRRRCPPACSCSLVPWRVLIACGNIGSLMLTRFGPAARAGDSTAIGAGTQRLPTQLVSVLLSTPARARRDAGSAAERPLRGSAAACRFHYCRKSRSIPACSRSAMATMLTTLCGLARRSAPQAVARHRVSRGRAEPLRTRRGRRFAGVRHEIARADGAVGAGSLGRSCARRTNGFTAESAVLRVSCAAIVWQLRFTARVLHARDGWIAGAAESRLLEFRSCRWRVGPGTSF